MTSVSNIGIQDMQPPRCIFDPGLDGFVLVSIFNSPDAPSRISALLHKKR
jgi:hypothetical protein